MILKLQADSPPLHEDAEGAVRVGNTRVLLDLVVHAFQDGATPEGIVQRYPALTLTDVYGVVAYYLRHRPEVEDYLRRREVEAAAIRESIEPHQPKLRELRARLLKEREA